MSARPLIAETFTSVQGEGRLAGTRSWFVRFSGCNLRCAWCDTPYASWAPEGERRSVEELIDEARRSGAKHAVVTGGEPMLFEEVVALTRGLRDAGLHVTIETAGTIVREAHADLMSISPKLANSAPPPPDDSGWRERHEARRLNLDALQHLIDHYPARQFKFVVRERADVDEIDELLARLRGWAPGDVMLMPEGVTPEALASRGWVEGFCAERGWRVSPRLHILLYGNTRGT